MFLLVMKSQYLLLPVPSDVSYFSNYSCDIYDPISLCNSDVDALIPKIYICILIFYFERLPWHFLTPTNKNVSHTMTDTVFVVSQS